MNLLKTCLKAELSSLILLQLLKCLHFLLLFLFFFLYGTVERYSVRDICLFFIV